MSNEATRKAKAAALKRVATTVDQERLEHLERTLGRLVPTANAFINRASGTSVELPNDAVLWTENSWWKNFSRN